MSLSARYTCIVHAGCILDNCLYAIRGAPGGGWEIGKTSPIKTQSERPVGPRQWRDIITESESRYTVELLLSHEDFLTYYQEKYAKDARMTLEDLRRLFPELFEKAGE